MNTSKSACLFCRRCFPSITNTNTNTTTCQQSIHQLPRVLAQLTDPSKPTDLDGTGSGKVLGALLMTKHGALLGSSGFERAALLQQQAAVQAKLAEERAEAEAEASAVGSAAAGASSSSSSSSRRLAWAGASRLLYVKVDEHRAPNATSRADFCVRGRVYLNPSPGAAGGLQDQGFVVENATGTLGSTMCVGVPYHCLVVAADGTRARGGPCSGSQATGWRRVYFTSH